MVTAVKIRRDEEAPGFEKWLSDAVEADSRKPGAIALEAGISEGYLYRLMSGRQTVVSQEIVSKLEDVLGVKYSEEGDRDA